MQAEMSIAWWPALVFGWPGPILAVIFCVVGIVRAKVARLIAAAVVVMPFSLYLGLEPSRAMGRRASGVAAYRGRRTLARVQTHCLAFVAAAHRHDSVARQYRIR
jgi:hypothetical protein